MNRFTICLAILILLLIIGCDNPGGDLDNSNSSYSIKGKPFGSEYTVLAEGSYNHTSSDSSLEIDIAVDSGGIYHVAIENREEGFDVQSEVRLPSGYWELGRSFIAPSDDTLTIFLSCESFNTNNPASLYAYDYSIRKYEPLDEKFHGQWMLNEYKATAWGESSSLKFSEEWADEVVFISADSVNRYYFYNVQGERLLNTQKVFTDNYFMEYHYTLESDTLRFHTGNIHGSMEMVFVRTETALEDMTWKEQWIPVSDDVLGTWYHSNYSLRFMEIIEGEITQDDFEEYSFNSAVETDTILTITKDSVIVFTPESDSFLRTSYPATRFELLHTFSRVESDQLIVEGAEFEGYSDIAAWIYKFKSTYKRYDGVLD